MAAAKASPGNAKSGGSTDSLSQIEGMIMGVVSAIPVPQFKAWASAYFHPIEELGAQKQDVSFGGFAKHAALLGLVTALLVDVLLFLSLLFRPSVADFVAVAIGAVVLLVIYPIMMVIGMLISSGIYYVIAKILGGKGGYMAQTLGLTLVAGGAVLISLPLQVLAIIPCIGFVFSLASLLVSLYALYSDYRLIKGVHQLSQMRAIAVIVIPILIVIALVVIAIIVMGAAFLTMFGAAAATPKYAPY